MTPNDQKNRNDVIEFATILYGASWREKLARTLGTTRRNLDHWMASQNPLPESIMLGIVNQMKAHVASQRHDIEEMDLRVTNMRRQIKTPTRSLTRPIQAPQTSEAVPAFGAQLRVVEQSSIG